MKILSLGFNKFRNLETASITPCENINIIYGDNAQGKTNIIEAIWLLTGNKSFRGAKESEFIKFNEDFAKINAGFYSQGRNQSAEIIYSKGKKEVFLNGVKKSGSSGLLGQMCSVVFSPEHLSLIKSGPIERRKFIDNALCQIKPSYRNTLLQYNKILANRNALLKDIPKNRKLIDTLDAWDYRLAVVGSVIIVMRRKYVNKLCEVASFYHSGISHKKEVLSIKYASTVPDVETRESDQIKDTILAMLNEHRNEEIAMSSTSIGPHRDDIDITINGENVRAFGSQGQQRSCVLSMKIAEEEIIRISTDEEPIVLLDDVLSELDCERQEFLLNEIEGKQVFITCCDPDSVKRLKNGSLFKIQGGSAECTQLS